MDDDMCDCGRAASECNSYAKNIMESIDE